MVQAPALILAIIIGVASIVNGGCASARDLAPGRTKFTASEVAVIGQSSPVIGGVFIAKARTANGAFLHLVVDTGSHALFLDPKIIEALSQRDRSGLRLEALFFNGVTLEDVPFVPLDMDPILSKPTIRIGDVEVRPKIDGIIGLPQFENMRVVFDVGFGIGAVSVTQRDSPSPKETMAFRVDNIGLPEIDIEIEGRVIPVILDMGFPGVLHLRESYDFPLSKPITTDSTPTMTFRHSYFVRRSRLSTDARLGKSYSVNTPAVFFGEGPELIGLGFFQGQRVTFDYRSRWIAIEPRDVLDP